MCDVRSVAWAIALPPAPSRGIAGIAPRHLARLEMPRYNPPPLQQREARADLPRSAHVCNGQRLDRGRGRIHARRATAQTSARVAARQMTRTERIHYPAI